MLWALPLPTNVPGPGDGHSGILSLRRAHKTPVANLGPFRLKIPGLVCTCTCRDRYSVSLSLSLASLLTLLSCPGRFPGPLRIFLQDFLLPNPVFSTHTHTVQTHRFMYVQTRMNTHSSKQHNVHTYLYTCAYAHMHTPAHTHAHAHTQTSEKTQVRKASFGRGILTSSFSKPLFCVAAGW